ncbi:tagatose-bisphosphate aldolase [Miniphocaeibacter halophilus]|uniref:Tagatose-bisphosphate aldolase n=1 Tax=Miniphocaeibacter halophilus TaxID=2931922 RepID=A0AC61MN35_9FIRM|nr:tagatose-bisphosphate aldolase [Miniphocaeibacter halophilus]QQK07011.1 tagatose-bisphosphate aldolase [Miniphocaeibacter halophilus]
MKKLTPNKKEALIRLSNSNNIIAALAIDQRGAIRKMMGKIDPEKTTEQTIVDFKIAVSRELTKYSSSILLDPEYGLPASKERDKNSGLLIAYEKTGYDANAVGRLPDLLPIWSVKRLKEAGADAVKILLYYDIDEGDEINEQKHAFIERVGSECVGEDIPFFLEIISYDAKIEDSKSKEYAKIKPHKVNDAMRLFSEDRYNVDVLKMEVPVNMDYVEGYGEDYIYTREEALQYFKEQSQASDLPFIFLSAGVSTEMFQETLRFAKEAGSTFNGVLCGRATWAKGVDAFMESEEKGYEWLKTEGKKNIEDLNKVIEETATPWTDKLA